MKILSISGILPIQGLIKCNDFLFDYYQAYLKEYPNDEIVFIRPTQHKSNLRLIWTGKTDLDLLKGRMSWFINNFRIEIFPYFSARRIGDLHALFSFSSFFFNRKKLDLLLKTHKFDIIHAQYIYPDGLLANLISRNYNIPYVITTHKELCYFKFPVSRFIAKKILKEAYHVLPINHINGNYFKGLGLKNIEVIPLGFSDDFIRPQKLKAIDNVSIVTVSSLLPYKNIKNVLFALCRLVSKYNVHYTLIGSGPEWNNLQIIARTNDLEKHISFLKQLPREQLADEMHKHDVFILTSFVETFGRVYFEAMAMGIPVICSKDSGIYGYYTEMKEGVTVIHDDIDDIVKKLEILISQPDLRTGIGLEGQKLVRGCTWKNIAIKNHSIYEDTLQQSITHYKLAPCSYSN